MLRLASDADVNGRLLRGLRKSRPDLDLVRSLDILPRDTPDPQVLDWAITDGRVLITNDRNTMVGIARRQVAAGRSIPGLIVTSSEQPIGDAIEDILLIAEGYSADELSGLVLVFLPLQA
jgi:hypothetical protein